LELILLKTGMILAFISVNSMRYHNIHTHWMNLHIINIGLRMIQWKWNL